MRASTDRHYRAARLALAITILGLSTAQASRLAVTPTRVNLKDDKAGSLTLRNRSTESILVQARVVHWTQEAGSDHYAPAREILVSPPIVEIPADADRVVRIAYTGPASKVRERTFRLILSEVVPSVVADPTVAIRFSIEFNLPIFVTSSGLSATPQLDWELESEREGKWRLYATNRGTAHAQVRSVNLTCGEGDNEEQVAGLHRARYVLSGSTISWPLAFDQPPCGLGAALRDPITTRVDYIPAPEFDATPRDSSIAGRISDSISISSRPTLGQVDEVALRVRAMTDFGPAEGAITMRAPTAQTAALEAAGR